MSNWEIKDNIRAIYFNILRDGVSIGYIANNETPTDGYCYIDEFVEFCRKYRICL